MRLDELRIELRQLAGEAHDVPDGGVERVHRVARRKHRVRIAMTTSAVVVVLGVTGAVLLRGSSRTPHVVAPADTVPTTTLPPPPPPFDAKAFFDQPRIPVGDESGKVRGTMSTAEYKRVTGLTNGAPPAPELRDTKVPVLNDDGKLAGYWIPVLGFVERSVADTPGFDAEALAAKKEAEWWASLTPEQRQQSLAHGYQPPNATTTTTP